MLLKEIFSRVLTAGTVDNSEPYWRFLNHCWGQIGIMRRSAVLWLVLAALSFALGQTRGISAPAELAGQIETALHDETALAGNRILVSVNETEIVLSGSVANRKQRRTADRIAESFAVNRKMIDKLVVRGENQSSQISR
jgi:hypothetical protein